MALPPMSTICFLLGYEGDNAAREMVDHYIGNLGFSSEQIDHLIAETRSLLPERSEADATVDMASALMMHHMHRRISDGYSSEAPVYTYQFDWPSPTLPELGAFHALELPFVFGTLDSWSFALGNNPPRKLSDSMMDAWIAFARSGNPNHNNIPQWPAYTKKEAATMIFSEDTHLDYSPLAWAMTLGEMADRMINAETNH